MGERKQITTKEFIERAKNVHGDRYIYTECVYVNSKTHVNIICKKHGGFKKLPNKFINGSGCVLCLKEKHYNAYSFKWFLELSREKHKDKYDYSAVEYINTKNKITIKCSCGNVFSQTPQNHIQGSGCPLCGSVATRIKTRETYIKKAFNNLIQPEDHKLIPLGNNKFAKVDNEDFDKVRSIKWHKNKRYARSNDTGYMHKMIIDCPEGMEIDHINGNGLDNRRCNLRVCSASENSCNTAKHKKYSSKYKGVSWSKANGMWLSAIKKDGILYKIGFFRSEVSAALSYDNYARRLHKDFARLNFPCIEKGERSALP